MTRTRAAKQPNLTRIGCAGWSIASAHKSLFGSGESMLARYASLFNAVEINSSFYRPHQRKTYERWATSVPENFRFSLKIPKTITHDLRLRHPGPLLDRFLEQATGLGGKLECLLVQLPPSFAFDARIASTFFNMLRRRWTGGIACEPRHASWFEKAAGELWKQHGVARVGADPALNDVAREAEGAGPYRYWRWHGSPRMYYSDYGDAKLDEFAAKLISRSSDAIPWVIFDNTAHGFATLNAASLQKRLANRDVKA